MGCWQPNVPHRSRNPTLLLRLAPQFRLGSINSGHHRKDAINPSLETLREIPIVPKAVNDVLATYDVSILPQLSPSQPGSETGITQLKQSLRRHIRCWPNEDFQDSGDKKHQLYDEHSMMQWCVGELTNIYHISDPLMSKQALLQVICSMEDTTSLQWVAVRSTTVHPQYQRKDTFLGDSTQWAINRLSASQIAVCIVQAANPPSHQ